MQRCGARITVASVSYLVAAAAVIFYLLPVGFALTGTTLLLAQLGAVLAGAALIAYVAIALRRATSHQAGMWEVAVAEGWHYRPDVSDRVWGGSIDAQIEHNVRSATDYIDARHADVPFEVATRTFTVGNGQGALMYATTAARIPISAEAPSIMLTARNQQGALSSLPRAPRRAQRLTLEGNFSDVFDVSVPTGYERDALYLLTPDLMALLLDTSADLDLEIEVGTLHVYFPPLDLTDPEMLQKFLTVMAALHERFSHTSRYYRDEDAPELEEWHHRRHGSALSENAKTLRTRPRVGPVAMAIVAPLVPLLIGIAWTQLAR